MIISSSPSLLPAWHRVAYESVAAGRSPLDRELMGALAGPVAHRLRPWIMVDTGSIPPNETRDLVRAECKVLSHYAAASVNER
ncbi:hypothetical protein AJ87_14590 [Rhizobium yanglingense]|nr:hypothetical protein AJ87_14590 [Rhizobium yanglingense]